MYLMDLLIVDQLFLGLKKILILQNNLSIGIKATLIGIEVFKLVFLYFKVMFGFVPSIYTP